MIQDFEIQLWHQIVFFSTLLVGVFKTEISNFLNALLSIWKKSYVKDQNIQILSDSGVWEDATIVAYNFALPFSKKRGGVRLRHQYNDGSTYEENLSFQQWKTLRIRCATLVPQQPGYIKPDLE